MSAQPSFSDNSLHAFIDSQLEGSERERLLAALESDAELRERVCALRRTKEWVNLAFADAHATPRPLPRMKAHTRLRLWAAAASVLLLCCGFLLGWSVSTHNEHFSSVVLRDIASGNYKVLLHVSRSDNNSFDEVLDGAELLLKHYREQGIQVDVLANAGGIDLLRVDISPQAKRIARMMRDYDNIHFIACTNSLQRLQEKGITPILINNTQQDKTAVEHIILRLQQGWTYLRV